MSFTLSPVNPIRARPSGFLQPGFRLLHVESDQKPGCQIRTNARDAVTTTINFDGRDEAEWLRRTRCCRSERREELT
jgi:hypothetical protein